jgi:hypothetical protein
MPSVCVCVFVREKTTNATPAIPRREVLLLVVSVKGVHQSLPPHAVQPSAVRAVAPEFGRHLYECILAPPDRKGARRRAHGDLSARDEASGALLA